MNDTFFLNLFLQKIIISGNTVENFKGRFLLKQKVKSKRNFSLY